MFKKTIILICLILTAFSVAALSQQKTVVKNNYAKRKLLGRHFLSLQWISQDFYGRAYVKQRKRVLYLKGEQKSRENDDYLKIDGVITEVSRYEFKFTGKVITKISHIGGGKVCVRDGDLTFKITGKRKYWRMQEMKNPCDTATDYVDIYFRK